MPSSTLTLPHALLLAAALLQAAATFDIFKRRPCQEGDLCLDSFIWCAGPNDDTSGCSFPDHAYPYHEAEYSSNPAALFLGQEYTLSFRNAVPEYPVEVRWSFGEAFRGTDQSFLKNITEGTNSITLKFDDWIQDFADTSDNVTVTDLTAAASFFTNILDISQPTAANDTTYAGRVLADHSSQFAVFNGIAEPYLNTQRSIGKHDMYDKWKLGVGVGVGIGVPALMTVSFLGGWFLSKGRRSKASMAKDSSST